MLLHEKWWIGLLAWIGIGIVPALIGSLWLPDLVERLRRGGEQA